jgi:hypothetical protein
LHGIKLKNNNNIIFEPYYLNMDYIPEYAMKINIDELNNLSLPDDIINNIKDYSGNIIPIPIASAEEKVDEYWIKLGRDTCNLNYWHMKCKFILHNKISLKHGDSFSKGFYVFDELKNQLDNLIHYCYPFDKKFINNIKLTKIFYGNNDNIISPPTKKYNKIPKKINSDENIYIRKFIERFNLHLNYLKKNVDKLPVRNNTTPINIKECNDEIIKCINKLIKTSNKMYEIIENTNIENIE